MPKPITVTFSGEPPRYEGNFGCKVSKYIFNSVGTSSPITNTQIRKHVSPEMRETLSHADPRYCALAQKFAYLYWVERYKRLKEECLRPYEVSRWKRLDPPPGVDSFRTRIDTIRRTEKWRLTSTHERYERLYFTAVEMPQAKGLPHVIVTVYERPLKRDATA